MKTLFNRLKRGYDRNIEELSFLMVAIPFFTIIVAVISFIIWIFQYHWLIGIATVVTGLLSWIYNSGKESY